MSKQTVQVETVEIRTLYEGRREVWIRGKIPGWSTTQKILDVWKVGGVLVVTNPMTMRPIQVLADDGQLHDFVEARTGVRP